MPPNVLWICTDQQRWDTLGCYGNAFVDTPHLDRLAERGVRFDRCFSQSPVCTPSRASFLTGRYPRTTGVRGNGQPIPEDETLITKLFSDAGYACGLAGKLHVSPANPEGGERMSERRIDDGYDEFHWSHHPGPDWPTNAYLHWLRDHGVDFEEEIYVDESTGARRLDRSSNFEGEPYADSPYVQIAMPPEHHHTTWAAEMAIDFVENAAGFESPWLYSVNTFDPHHAFDPPAEYLDRYVDRLDELPLPNYVEGELDDKPAYQRRDHEGAYNQPGYYPAADMDPEDHRLVRAAYWAMIDLIDDQVGRMLDALERTGQREDTLVVFMSDHGEMLGDHGIYLKGPYFYEPMVRVPLIVDGPGVAGGRATDALVELSDIAPTLLDVAGIDHPPGMQACSFRPLLAGEREDHREDVYCEYYDAKTGHTDPDPFGTMLRTDRYKLVRMHSLDTGELYDLEADPDETHNRWNDPEYRDVQYRLLERLADRMAGTVDPLPERVSDW